MSIDYPCSCENSKWLVDNSDVFFFKDGHWYLKWTEFDRVGIKSNIQVFCIRIYNCVFCGKQIEDI